MNTQQLSRNLYVARGFGRAAIGRTPAEARGNLYLCLAGLR